MIVFDDHFLLLSELLVTFLALALSLLHLERPISDLLLQTVNLALIVIDLLGALLVVFKEFLVVLGLGLCLGDVSVEVDLELLVQVFDLLDQIMLHRLKLLHVLVLGLLTKGFKIILHLLKLGVLLLIDGLDHVA